jgi:hypothetical protein
MNPEIKKSRKYKGDKLSFPKNYYPSDRDNKEEIIINISHLSKFKEIKKDETKK